MITATGAPITLPARVDAESLGIWVVAVLDEEQGVMTFTAATFEAAWEILRANHAAEVPPLAEFGDGCAQWADVIVDVLDAQGLSYAVDFHASVA